MCNGHDEGQVDEATCFSSVQILLEEEYDSH